MSIIPLSQWDLLGERNAAVDEEVRGEVLGAVSALHPQQDLVERRRESRYPFPHLIYLTPVGKDGAIPEGDAVVVVGRHLSACGLGFYHTRPLPYRRMIASLEAANKHWIGFLVDLSWCRFTRKGWYESGGRFLQAITSPLEESAC